MVENEKEIAIGKENLIFVCDYYVVENGILEILIKKT